MSDVIPGLFDEDTSPVPLEQVVFDYRLLSADKREFVLQKTDETQWLLKSTADKIIQIGKNLREVKERLPHGMFLPWLQSEFRLSEHTARNFMRVSERFEEKSITVMDFSVSALYLLAAPSTPQEAIDEAMQRADSGEKITKSLAKQIIEAQEVIRKAQEAEAEARAEATVKQQLLLKTEREATSKIDGLTQQIEDLQEKMRTIVIPEVRIEEKQVIAIPQETQEKLATLQQSVKTLEEDLKKEKVAVPPSAQSKLESLQKQLERLKEEREQQEKEKEQQEERIKKLNEDINTAIHKREFAENADRIRQGWRMITSEVHSSMMRLLGQWPTPIDVQVFDADDWARVDHLKSTLRRVLEECDNLRYESDGMVVNSEGSTYALSTYDMAT